jgi:hypothetical protein
LLAANPRLRIDHLLGQVFRLDPALAGLAARAGHRRIEPIAERSGDPCIDQQSQPGLHELAIAAVPGQADHAAACCPEPVA